MRSRNDETIPTLDESESVDLEPVETVIVGTGGGRRFHRPDSLGFETACKTRFSHPVHEIPASEATREGFTPCEKRACFGKPRG